MDHITITVNNYGTLKEALKIELNRAALSFCRIGYLLKKARDDVYILDGSGYSDVNEFAAKEFGLDKSQVSRFVRINDRFSINGNSEFLKEEYESFGSAKLSLMLLLPDEINEKLSPEYSKSDIDAIVKDYKDEKAISDMEVMMEDKSDVPDEFIAAVVKQLNDEHPEPLEWFEESIEIGDDMGLEAGIADLKEAYMPDGESIYNIRIAGQGKFMIKMRDNGITISNMRHLDEELSLSWQEFLEAVREDRINRPAKPKQEEKKVEKPKKPKRVEPSKKPQKAKGLTEEEKKEAEEFFAPIVKGIKAKYADVAPVQPEGVEQTQDNAAQEDKTEGEENKEAAGPEEKDPVDITHPGLYSKVEPEETIKAVSFNEAHPAAGPEVVEDDEDLDPPLKKLLYEINASIRNLEEQIKMRNWNRALMYVEDIEFRVKQMRGL